MPSACKKDHRLHSLGVQPTFVRGKTVCPCGDSNSNFQLRRLTLYPLRYRGVTYSFQPSCASYTAIFRKTGRMTLLRQNYFTRYGGFRQLKWVTRIKKARAGLAFCCSSSVDRWRLAPVFGSKAIQPFRWHSVCFSGSSFLAGISIGI